MRRPALALMLALTGTTLASSASADPEPARPTPPVQERWGWSAGVPAAGTGDALAPIDPVQVALPTPIASLVTGPTALLYFAPTCPHCRHAMPELTALAQQQPELAWLGVATGSSTTEALDEFRDSFGVTFDIVIDTDRRFAWATGARSTPSLFLVQPAAAGAVPTSGDPVAEGTTVVTVTEAYLPFARGMGPIVAMRRNSSGARVTADGATLPADPYRDFDGYLGVRACAACHGDEATSWAISHHAGAYQSLYDRERAEDLSCIGCHVVGMGSGGFGTPEAPVAGGFALGDHSSPQADVGCEACHGPAGPHDGDPAATPTGGGPTDTCVLCHDANHSVAFEVGKGMPHIDHYAAVDMDEDTLRARLEALADGTAARPLLAFPTGPTAGADTCRSCHKVEHKGWSKHGHARAMDSLEGDDATNVACAACHATAARYGGMGDGPTTMADLRVDEGVGCEACHGPGADHVADPRMDNIVRLGETCPECVLEGICTSCHVPEWDPTWTLDGRLHDLPYRR